MAGWEWPGAEREAEVIMQPSKLVGGLFPPVEEGQQQSLTILHLGVASPETMDLFSRYHCRLYINDLFERLPFVFEDEEVDLPLAEQFQRELAMPADARFDICLFWDFFNYLDREAIAAFLSVLRPHLHPGTMAHAYAVHNLRAPRVNQRYGIVGDEEVCVRPRARPLPGYSPLPQNQLKTLLLDCFRVDRSVLLTDSRLELLLRAGTAITGR